MKTLTPTAATEIAKLTGTEPFITITIEWSAGSVLTYTDKDKILNLANFNCQLGDKGVTRNVEVTLDDVSGELKSIFDTKDIHKVKATVYQDFTGFSEADRIKLLEGRILTPATWDERDRTVTFTITSEIDGFEVGFSPEEGQLDFVNEEFVGRPWPLCFGKPIHVPAQKTSNALSGVTLDDICVVDQTLYWKMEQLRISYFNEAYLMYFFRKVADGAFLISPPAEDILTLYVQAILASRIATANINAMVVNINRHINVGVHVGAEAEKKQAQLKQEALVNLALISQSIQANKERVAKLVQLASFKYNTQKDAMAKVIEAYRNMQQLMAQYVALQNEVCNQQQCQVGSIRVQGGEKFPQGEDVDVYVNNVKLRGIFDGELFTFTDYPTAALADVEVDTWKRDDAPCAPDNFSNGLNLFWLKTYKNLTGMYLFVKKRGTEERHIITVERQEGLKVYFNLVAWPAADYEQGPSIDSAVGKLKATPFIPTPWGGTLPADLFTNDWRESEWNQPEPARLLSIINQIPGGVNQEEFDDLATLVFLSPYDRMGEMVIQEATPRDTYTIIGEDVEVILEASGMVHNSWLEWDIPPYEVPDTLFWKADVGSSVRLKTDDCALYICNILPSTIIQVSAYRTLKDGTRVFVPVPSGYYIKNVSANLGTIDVTCITFPTDLKNIQGEGWEDQPYVTLESSVGPNVADVIQHLIETYTDDTVNAASFADIATKLANYPLNFALFDRPNVLEIIDRIAWESRCAVYKESGEWFLKYLSEEPTEVATLSEDDFDATMHYTVSIPSTESIVTRLVATWNENYLPIETKPPTLVLRHNVKKYGLVSQDQQFITFNDRGLVEKSATFWLIRGCNSWKSITFQTFLKHLDFELLDAIKLDLNDQTLASAAVKGVIQAIDYDTASKTITVTVELPVKVGTMEYYKFYWPANIDADETFPTEVEIEEGYAGGYGPGEGVRGNIDDC